MTKKVKLFIAIGIPLAILLIPSGWLPVEGLTTIEHRLVAIFVMAALLWVLEPIPIYATSVLIIVTELLLVSNKSFVLFQKSGENASFGSVLNYQDILATFASPIIILFLGGFFLASAATKYQIDTSLARVLLRPFGNKPRYVMLGLMMVTAVFSMFMSNTATTAMMLAILYPVLKLLDPDDKGRIAFVLAIPFAANIGGLGTPIGTPPNAIALKYLTGSDAIGFGTWMSFAVPFVLVMLLFSWLLLIKIYRPTTHVIDIDIGGKFRKNWKAMTVYATFGLTILLWLTDFWHGMNAYVVAMIPVVVFSVTSILNVEDLKHISWDILWLMAGGIALGLGLEKSGLALHIIDSIPFDTFSPYMIVLLVTTITIVMATFMSNTATANLLMPIMAMLGASTSSLIPLGGSKMIMLAVAFSASLAMSLAVSTPPNAMAHGTGEIQSKHMARTGLIIGLVGLGCVYLLMTILNRIHFL